MAAIRIPVSSFSSARSALWKAPRFFEVDSRKLALLSCITQEQYLCSGFILPSDCDLLQLVGHGATGGTAVFDGLISVDKRGETERSGRLPPRLRASAMTFVSMSESISPISALKNLRGYN